MAKATLTLPDGTTVTIDGSPDEIKRILTLHKNQQTEVKKSRGHKSKAKPTTQATSDKGIDLQELINLAKSSDDFELIEKNVLDRTSLVDRILLPLYVAAEHISEQQKLTTGDISKFLSQLGVNIAQPNVAKTLSSTALRYVIGDKIRKKGQAVGYRLSRKGTQYLTAVIKGTSND